jgi:hypothetical protein
MLLDLIDVESAQDHSVKVRKLHSLSALRYLTSYNVLHIWECPAHLYIQSLPTMIMVLESRESI